MSWYALSVRSGYECRLRDTLSAFVGESFFPYREVKSQAGPQRQRHEVILQRPFFPGYVFIDFDLHQRSQLPQHTGIPQGYRLVSDSPIPTPEIASVKLLMSSQFPVMEHPHLKIAESVRLYRGPLAGVEGKIVRFTTGQLLVVSIEMLGRSVATQVEADWIEPVKGLAA